MNHTPCFVRARHTPCPEAETLQQERCRGWLVSKSSVGLRAGIEKMKCESGGSAGAARYQQSLVTSDVHLLIFGMVGSIVTFPERSPIRPSVTASVLHRLLSCSPSTPALARSIPRRSGEGGCRCNRPGRVGRNIHVWKLFTTLTCAKIQKSVPLYALLIPCDVHYAVCSMACCAPRMLMPRLLLLSSLSVRTLDI